MSKAERGTSEWPSNPRNVPGARSGRPTNYTDRRTDIGPRQRSGRRETVSDLGRRSSSGSTPRQSIAAWKRTLHRFAHSRKTKLATGLFLLITALAELTEGLLLDLDEALDPSHALVALGALLVIQSLAEIFEAAEFVDEAESHDE